jgi:hypothetical protein
MYGYTHQHAEEEFTQRIKDVKVISINLSPAQYCRLTKHSQDHAIGASGAWHRELRVGTPHAPRLIGLNH